MKGARWWPARRRAAVLAVLSAAATGATAGALGGSAWHLFGGAGYVALAAWALFAPAAISAQVIGGQVLAGSVLLAPGGPAPLLVLPLVAAVVITAELLGVVARLELPIRRAGGEDLRRAAVAAAIGGAAYGAVVLAAALPGPSGLTGIALASAACVVLAVVLVRSAREG